MPLKIVSPEENITVKNIILTVYGQPGIGKTSLAFTAKKPLLLDFDGGVHRAANRGHVVQAANWSDVVDMAASDLEPYDTIVIDTVGRALDVLGVAIGKANPKLLTSDGSLTMSGFGALKSKFQQFISRLRSFGKDIVFLAHMVEQQTSRETVERIDAQGASKNEICKLSDAICRIRISDTEGRFLDFDPREGGFGKNPVGFPQIPFPNPKTDPNVLAKVIENLKSGMNRNAAQSLESAKEEKLWQEAFAEAVTVEDFNKLIVPLAKERKGRFGQAVREEAKRRGYAYDAKTGLFSEREAVHA